MKKLVVLMLVSILMAGCGAVISESEISQESVSGEENQGEELSGNSAQEEFFQEECFPEEALQEKAEATVFSNWKQFVKIGNTVYFHGPDALGMRVPALFGDYTGVECGETILYAYDCETGETTPLFDDHSYGEIAYSDGKLLLTEYEKAEGEEYGTDSVYTVNLDGTGFEKLCDGYLKAADDKGIYAVTYEYFPEDQQCMLKVWKGNTLVQSLQMQAYARVYGINDTSLVYDISDYANQTNYIYSWDFVKNEIVLLGDLGYISEANGPDQICFRGDCFYMSRGIYEGTGHFFSGGAYLKANLKEENSLVQVEEFGYPGVEEEANHCPPFLIKNGEFVKAEGIPNTGAVIWNEGTIGYYDESGSFVRVAEGYAYTVDEVEEVVTEVELVEFVDGKLYGVQNEEWRAPEEDIGWRYAYERKMTYIMQIDAVTGERTDIAYGQNPKLVEGDEDETM